MIEIELPDGSIAEFPEGTPDNVIQDVLRKQFAPPQEPQQVASGKSDQEMSWGDTAMDAVKSAGTGIVEGAVSVASLPRDAGQWLGEQATWGIGRLMGQSNEDIAAQQAKAAQAMDATGTAAPNYQQVMGAVEGVTGPLYQPKGTVGEYARTTGQFAAGALAGPGGIARKAAMTVAPGVASEAAGQATEGTALEPYARIAGGLAGGIASAGRGNIGTKKMLKDVGDPDAAHAAVKAETNQMYQQLRAAGIKYDANGVNKAISDVTTLRIDPVLDPKAARLRDLFVQHVNKSPDFEDIDNLKQIATGILRSTADKRDKMFVGRILDKLNEVTDKGAFVTNGTLPAGQVKALVAKAKDYARRNILADQIDEMGRKAGYYVSGTESGTRNQFASYLKSQKGKGLSEAERSAFDAVTRREGPMNIAHMMASRFSMPTMGVGGGMLGGPVGAAAAVGGNLLARKLMEGSTKKAVNNALKTVLAGKQKQAVATGLDQKANADRLARALLATDSARRSAQIPFLTDANGREYAYPGSGQ